MRLLAQAWHANTLDDWALAAAIAMGVLFALALLMLVVVRAFRALASRTASDYAVVAASTAAATRLWILLPLALFAGASALDLPVKLGRLVDAITAVALMLQSALWINRFILGWIECKAAQRPVGDGEALTALSLLAFAARVTVWAVTLLLVLDHLGFDVTALVAGLGVGGVAVALAVQSILGDLFASLSIVLDKPFVVGDFIVVDGLRGTVERVGIKTTRLRSLDGELLVFSNADLLKSRIRNFQRMHDRRVEFSIGVTYQTSLDKLQRIPQWLRAIIEEQQQARFDRAHFKQYGDSALIFEIVYYVLSPDYNVYMNLHQTINLAIFERFGRESVHFAYPTRTVFLDQSPALAPAQLGHDFVI